MTNDEILRILKDRIIAVHTAYNMNHPESLLSIAQAAVAIIELEKDKK